MKAVFADTSIMGDLRQAFRIKTIIRVILAVPVFVLYAVVSAAILLFETLWDGKQSDNGHAPHLSRTRD